MPFISIFTAGVILLLVMAGCNQRQKHSTNAVAQNTSTAQQKTDSGDIFDEFYKDEKKTPNAEVAEYTSAQKENNFSTSEIEPNSSKNFSENGRYVIQISTVRSKALANRIVKDLNAKGYPAYVVEVQNPTPSLSGTFYRIRIGGFDKSSVAKDFGESTMKQSGYEYWVDNKTNDTIGIVGSGLGDAGSSGSFQSAPAAEQSIQPAPASNDSWGSTSTTSSSSNSAAPETTSPSTGSSVISTGASNSSSTEYVPEGSPSSTTTTTTPSTPSSGSTGTGSIDWGSDTSSGW